MLDISQENFNNAEAILITVIREKYPTLDLSKGTVLRELLIKPAATIYADNSNRIDDLRDKYSLNQLQDIAEDPGTTDLLLSNFMSSVYKGAQATGQVIMRFMFDQGYSIPKTFILTTAGGLSFSPEKDTTIVSTTGTDYGIKLTEKDGYYFAIVPFISTVAGEDSNIPQHTTLDSTTPIQGFSSATSYTTFVGGSSPDTTIKAINKLKYSITNRSLESRYSIQAKLSEQFPTLKDISVLGMGDIEQLRDKHYTVATGGRVDIYAKSFIEMPTISIRKTAIEKEEEQSDGTIRKYIAIEIDKEDVPGYYMVKGIYEYSDTEGIGSLIFKDTRSADLSQSFHDIKVVNRDVKTNTIADYRESDFSVYQTAIIEIQSGAPKAGKEYRLDIWYTPYLKDIQDYVDSKQHRNIATDILIRSPIVGITSVKAVIKLKDSINTSDFSIQAAKDVLMEFVNNRGFNNILTKDQLIGVLFSNFDIIDNIDMSDIVNNGKALSAVFRLAGNKELIVTSDVIDINTISDSLYLFSPNTTLFSLSADNIFLTVV